MNNGTIHVFNDGIGIDSRDSDTSIELISRGRVSPSVNIHRRWNGGAIVGDIGLKSGRKISRLSPFLENRDVNPTSSAQ